MASAWLEASADRDKRHELAEAKAAIGKTQLREYFGKDERKSVADWTHTVKERLKKALLDPATRDRIPLPRNYNKVARGNFGLFYLLLLLDD